VPIVIPIDGPTSSGKSSVGYLFSKKIGFHYVDSGTIFRSGTLLILQKKVPLDNEEKVAEVFASAKIEFKDIDNKVHTFLNGEDVSDILHNPEVTKAVPVVSMYKKVREASNKLQRQIASEQNTVMAGRDIGTEIFPDAKLKFYLTADIQIRAFRRLAQLREKNPDISYEQVLEEMIDRDKKDMIRKISPLRIAPDAIIIENTTATSKESVEKMLSHFKQTYES
jgi:cytidylate kinase